MQTTGGMMPPAGAADVVAGTIGAGRAGVTVLVGAAVVVVGCTVTVLGATVTVETVELAAAEDLSLFSLPPAIATTTKSATTAAMPPKIHGFFDFF
jgi:hypothetical protein